MLESSPRTNSNHQPQNLCPECQIARTTFWALRAIFHRLFRTWFAHARDQNMRRARHKLHAAAWRSWKACPQKADATKNFLFTSRLQIRNGVGSMGLSPVLMYNVLSALDTWVLAIYLSWGLPAASDGKCVYRSNKNIYNVDQALAALSNATTHYSKYLAEISVWQILLILARDRRRCLARSSSRIELMEQLIYVVSSTISFKLDGTSQLLWSTSDDFIEPDK